MHLCLILGAALLGTASPAAALLTHDAYGVPHLQAADRASLMHTYGTATVGARLWQLETSRRASRGTLAALLGPAFVAADRQLRRSGYTEAELQAQFDRLPAPVRQDLTHYAAGINAALAALPATALPFELAQLGQVPAPWKVTDSIALGAFLLRRFGERGGREAENLALLQDLQRRHGSAGGQRLFDDLRWVHDPEAPTTLAPGSPVDLWQGPGGADLAASLPPGGWPLAARRGAPLAASVRARQARLRPQGGDAAAAERDAAALWQRLGVASRLGSFALALAPQPGGRRSALLYGGPQMRQSVPNIVHEVSQQVGNHRVVGMAMAGIPWVLIGASEALSWTTTSGQGDNVDLFVETLCRSASGAPGSQFAGQCVPLQRRDERLEVAGGAPQQLTVWRSLHGPLRDWDGRLPAQVVAERRQHWQREVEALAGFYAMNRATSLPAFAAATRTFVTSHHFLYADRDGHIGYWQGGEVPERPAGSDFRLPLPGDGSAELGSRLQPRASQIDPPSGVLANWNNLAWEGTPNGDDWMGGAVHRVRDLQARLAADAARLDFDGLDAVVADIGRVSPCGTLAADLKAPLLAALGPRPRQPEAVALLQAWGGLPIVDARSQAHFEPGYLLWEAWMGALDRALFLPLLGGRLAALSPSLRRRVILTGLGQPPPLPVRGAWLDAGDFAAQAATALDEAVAGLRQRYGARVADWREPRPRERLEHPMLGDQGSFWLANRATYGLKVEAGPGGVRLRTIFAPGQSGHIDARGGLDPHFADLVPLYAAFDHKPEIWLSGGPAAAAEP